MPGQVPAHFHKEDRISEVDLIPDGKIYDDLPLSAEAGRWAIKKNGAVYEVWRFIDGAWQQFGGITLPIAESDVTNLVADLAAIVAALAGKAATSHTHAAADIVSGLIAQARLGSGSGGAGTKVLYDDQTWDVLPTPPGSPEFAADVIPDISTVSGGDYDEVVTLGFQPSLIELHYYIQGHTQSVGTNKYTQEKGIAVFDGTGVCKLLDVIGQSEVNVDEAPPNAQTAVPNDSTDPTIGDNSGSSYTKVTVSVISITATGFTVRRSVETDGTFLGRAKVAFKAYK